MTNATCYPPRVMTTTCFNCHVRIPKRRDPKSGQSFCSEPSCQAVKQRAYRERKKNGVILELQSPLEAVKTYLSTALHRPRRLCKECNLEDAVDGYLHRSTVGGGSCSGTGGAGRDVPLVWFDLVHPERSNG